MGYQTERRVAVQAVMQASRLCQRVRAMLGAGDTIDKSSQNPVTIADFGAQAVVSLALTETFPGDPVVGEEDASVLRMERGALLREKVVSQTQAMLSRATEEEILSAIDRCAHPGGARGRYWVLDPIDGTKGFLRGEQYAVALALIEEGEVVLGVLGCPNLPLQADRSEGPAGCLFVAVKGQGVVVRGLDDPAESSVRVSQVADPTQATFCESVEPAHSSHDETARVAAVLGVTAPPLRMDSQCKYAAVARGQADIYLRLSSRPGYREKIWDHAAGWLVIKEAGGEVTDAVGRPFDFSLGRKLEANTGVVATNGLLHGQVIEAVKQIVRQD